MQQPRFQGKRALVTGSTRGLGRTIAEWLARDGATVFVSGRHQSDVDTTVSELRAQGYQADGLAADLKSLEATHQFATNALASAGPFDILVNNAGFSKPQSFLEVTDDDWDAEIGVNIRAPFVISQHVARAMIEHGIAGRIINISSIGVFAAHKHQMVYNIAKGGVQAMTRCMAFELGSHGITANCVAPGAVPDRPGATAEYYTEALAIWSDRIPTKRIGKADDIAHAVCFFCEDAASWITGQTLLVDGGHLSYLREE